ncbi:MAG: hypothetical protein ACP5MD_07100 [Verrucomicrobiia bacterium]
MLEVLISAWQRWRALPFMKPWGGPGMPVRGEWHVLNEFVLSRNEVADGWPNFSEAGNAPTGAATLWALWHRMLGRSEAEPR